MSVSIFELRAAFEFRGALLSSSAGIPRALRRSSAFRLLRERRAVEAAFAALARFI